MPRQQSAANLPVKATIFPLSPAPAAIRPGTGQLQPVVPGAGGAVVLVVVAGCESRIPGGRILEEVSLGRLVGCHRLPGSAATWRDTRQLLLQSTASSIFFKYLLGTCSLAPLVLDLGILDETMKF